jgi:hypothetical protein
MGRPLRRATCDAVAGTRLLSDFELGECMKRVAIALALMAGFAVVPATAAVNVDAYVKRTRSTRSRFARRRILRSPGAEDRTALVVIERATNKVTGPSAAGEQSRRRLRCNNDRLVIASPRNSGPGCPQLTGEPSR